MASESKIEFKRFSPGCLCKSQVAPERETSDSANLFARLPTIACPNVSDRGEADLSALLVLRSTANCSRGIRGWSKSAPSVMFGQTRGYFVHISFSLAGGHGEMSESGHRLTCRKASGKWWPCLLQWDRSLWHHRMAWVTPFPSLIFLQTRLLCILESSLRLCSSTLYWGRDSTFFDQFGSVLLGVMQVQSNEHVTGSAGSPGPGFEESNFSRILDLDPY